MGRNLIGFFSSLLPGEINFRLLSMRFGSPISWLHGCLEETHSRRCTSHI